MSLEDLIKRDKASNKGAGGQRGGRGGFKGGRGGAEVPRLRQGAGIFKKNREGGFREGRQSFGQGQRINRVSRRLQ